MKYWVKRATKKTIQLKNKLKDIDERRETQNIAELYPMKIEHFKIMKIIFYQQEEK